jgi:hypothetical protein
MRHIGQVGAYSELQRVSKLTKTGVIDPNAGDLQNDTNRVVFNLKCKKILGGCPQ